MFDYAGITNESDVERWWTLLGRLHMLCGAHSSEVGCSRVAR